MPLSAAAAPVLLLVALVLLFAHVARRLPLWPAVLVALLALLLLVLR